ncbi:helix-turn-helix domain-containing protein [Paenibacillus sp. NPDC056579]|uniref:helix-turn-helix domain-containing protein n=1 Tax=Paenibacillus sp. NPDC056579 TaxID=3345871 RepID=UPI003686B581
MLKHVHHFMNGGFRSLLYRFFYFFLAVSLLIQCINLITYRISLHYFESELEQSYKKSLSNVAASLNSVFTGMYNSNFLLSLDSSAMELFSDDFQVDAPEKYAHVSQTIRSLNRIRLMSDYVDSVFMYKKKNNLVISNQGTFTGTEFFGKTNALEQYSEAYWRQYSPHSKPFQILPPSRSVSQNGTYLLPIVQTAIAEYRSNDLYVINLKIDPIIQALIDSKLTPNSKLYVVDDNRQLIASTEMYGATPSDIEGIVKQLQDTGSPNLRTRFQNEDILAIQTNTRFIFKNLNMIALVPEADILVSMKDMRYWTTLMSVIALSLSILLSFLFSKRLYAPIRSLLAKISPAAPPTTNEYKLLDHEFHRMRDSMDTLHSNLTSMYPLAIEQWFVRMLRFNRVPDEADIQTFLQKCRLNLQHESFAAALIRMKYAKSFYMNYSSAEQNTLHVHWVNQLKSHLPAAYQSYLLEMEAGVFCILVNLPHDAERQELSPCFENMFSLLRHDENLHDIFVGVGNVHRGFDGLQQSYLEAMKSLWRLSPLDNKRIHYYDKEDEASVTILIGTKEEKRLFHLLASCKREELFEELRTIIQNHISVGFHDVTIKELYMHLFVIGSQVLKHKDATLPEATYREYIRMIVSEHTVSIDGLSEFITGYYDKIMDTLQPKDQLESLVFKPYIDTHYHEDMCLEGLAEKFHTTPNYMSRLLKKELGRPFHQYLQEVRIQKAKELLAGTDLYIQDIWAQVGFNNRNSFIRSFKNVEGISPMEYRLQYSVKAQAKQS